MKQETEKGRILVTTLQPGGMAATMVTAAAARLLRERWSVRILLGRGGAGETAQALASAGAEILQGSLSDRARLKAALQGVHGVFLVQPYLVWGGVTEEVARAKSLAVAARTARVKHMVYISAAGAERAPEVSWLAGKRQVERYIMDLSGVATVLRPVFPMEAFVMPRPLLSLLMAALAHARGAERPLQLVSADDVAFFAVRAFEHPGWYDRREIEIAGDSLTVPQIARTYREVTGRRLPHVGAPGVLLRQGPRAFVQVMAWLQREGYQADIEGLRDIHKGLMPFATWLKAYEERPIPAPPRRSEVPNHSRLFN